MGKFSIASKPIVKYQIVLTFYYHLTIMEKKLFLQKLNKKKVVKIVAISAGILIVLPLIFILLVNFGAFGKLPTKEALANIEHQRASEIYSADSILIGKFYLNDRQPIPFKNMPKNLKEALIAIEDERFYDHSGTDIKSMFRVALKSVLLGDESSGGGSTITQQLAKNLYPRRERSNKNLVINKVKEMLMANRIETIYTKDEILALYLNTVSFGDNTYGIEAASRKFFNTGTDSLKTEQAAVLVGMLKATYGYNPRVFPEKSRIRRNLVLYNMYRNGFISEQEKDSLTALKLKLNYRDYDHNNGLAPYFREAVRKELLPWCQENEVNLYTDGLKIYTTLNYELQQLAEKNMLSHLENLQIQFEKAHGSNAPWLSNPNLIKKIAKQTLSYKKLKKAGLKEHQIWDSLSIKRPMNLPSYKEDKEVNASTLDSIAHFIKFLNVGSLSVDPNNGAIRSWIGGVNYNYFKYDHVNQSKRQVGSTFKPIVYLAALEQGVQPCDYFSAREVEYENLKGWSPSNSGDKDEAYLNYSMEEALTNSVNTVTVKILEKTGINNVIEQAKKMGIGTELPKEPAIALGAGEIKLIEMAKAYSSIANYGKVSQPYFIQNISSVNDSLLYTHKKETTTRTSLSQENAAIIINMMQSVVDRGTAARIRNTYGLSNDIAGKTGTTQNNKDAWFAAITPKLVHITWVGLDQHEIGFSSTAIGQGANAALPVFAKLYKDMNGKPEFDSITKAKFKPLPTALTNKLSCDPVKRDGFLKRLFTNPNKKKKKKFQD